MRSPEKLDIYNDAIEISVEIESLLRASDSPRSFASNQLLRSAYSIADNIAEGCGYDSDAMMRKHCRIAMGSLLEAQTQLRRLIRIGDLPEDSYRFVGELGSIRRRLYAFIRHLDTQCDDG